jgi:hypothetical protein
MSFSVSPIDPLYALGGNVPVNKPRTKAEVQQEFVSVFLSQIMKDVFKAQSSMFGDEGEMGMFADNMYNDVFLSKVTRDLAANPAFAFDKLFKGSNKWQ